MIWTGPCNGQTVTLSANVAVSVVGPPSGSYPGSGEDATLSTGINGVPTVYPSIKSATAGDVLSIQVDSPLGSFYYSPFILAAQLWTPGSSAPSGPGSLASELHIDSGAVILVGPNAYSMNPVLSPGGQSVSLTIPLFLSPQNVMLQGLLLPWAGQPVNNGFFATTDGHVIEVQ